MQAASNATALSITPASLTVTYNAAAATSTYGMTPSGLTGTVSSSGLVNGDTLAGVTSGTAAWTTGATAASNVGAYGINGSGLSAASANYTISFAQNPANAAALTVNPASVTVTYVAAAESSTYGSSPAAPTGTVTTAGLVNGDTLGSVASGTAAWATTATSASGVGSYAITGSGLSSAGNSNYTVGFAQAAGNATALTVNPAALTVTYLSNTPSVVYGTDILNVAVGGQVLFSGLVNGDTDKFIPGLDPNSVVLGIPSFKTNYTAGSGVGSYSIIGSGLIGVSPNYTYSFVQAASNAAAITVTPASATLTYNAATATSTYGTTPSGLSGSVSASGLVLGDTVATVTSGTAQWTTSATAASSVGKYGISGSGLTASNANYTITFAQNPANAAALTVNPASVTVSYVAAAQTSTYGSSLAAPTGTVATLGLVNGDTLASIASGTAAWNTTATSSSNAGRYAITGSGLSSTGNGNYTVSFAQDAGNANALTINPASLTVTYTAKTAASTYGTAATGLAGSVDAVGLVNGDTLGGVTSGSAAFTTTATAASGTGSYAITGSGLTASSANYNVTFAQAAGNASALTINPASLAVTYTAKAATSTYGTAPSGLTGSVGAVGLVNGDTLGGVTTGTAAWTTTASATTGVGSYVITGSGLSANTRNYTVTFAQDAGNAQALTINPASLAVTANAQSRSYGAANSPLTFSASGLVNGDQLTGSLATGATAASGVGKYAITQGSLSAGANYVLAYTGADLTVSPAALTVTYTASPASSTYGTAPSGLSGSVGVVGLVNGDTLGGVTIGTAAFSTSATAASGVGSYAINGSGLTASSANYAVTFAQAAGNASALTINPASLAVTYTAKAATSTYGTAPSGLTGSVSSVGLVNGDTLAGVTSGTAAWTSTASATTGIGSYVITGSGLSANTRNYTVTFAQDAGNASALTINPASLAVTANAQSRSYGAANSPLTFSASGLVNGDTLTGSLATGATAASGVGKYAITQGSLSAGANYVLAYTGANLTVSPAALTVTYTAKAATSTYGTAPSGLSGSVGVVGLVNGDTLAGVTSGTAAFSTSATAASGVGSYAISGSGLSASSANYNVTFAQAAGNASALTINPASLAVTYTAKAATSTYGTAPSGLTGSVSSVGLVNGDTLGGVTSGTAAWTSSASATTGVGSYVITGSGLSANTRNYTVTFAQDAGNAQALTINPASLAVTANAQSRSYGAANSPLTFSASGLVNGDTLSGSLATGATNASAVGSYAITQGSLSAGANYVLAYTGANLTVTPAALTVTYTANIASSTYGTAPGRLSGSVSASGLVNGDLLSGVTSGTAAFSTSATAASGVGSYAINGSGLSASSANYAVTFAQAAGNASALTINPAVLTVTYRANKATSTYGTTPSGLAGSVSATGLVNGDTLGVATTGTVAWTTTASATTGIGSYAITGSGLAAGTANYTVTFGQAAGNASALTINPASLAVIANGQTRVYGAANPTLTFSATGLVNGDTLSGSLAAGATTASGVGSYGITQGTLSAGANYTLTYTGANLTVTPATLTYIADPVSRLVNAVNPEFTGSVTGYVNGDSTASATTGTLVFGTTATASSPPGRYAILGSGLSAANYVFVQAAGNATALLITAATDVFGSNTVTATLTPPAIPQDNQVLSGSNDVNPMDMDTGGKDDNCTGTTNCTGTK